MSCKYCDFDGKCQLFNPHFEQFGVDEDGYCICEDDENPEETCEDYDE